MRLVSDFPKVKFIVRLHPADTSHRRFQHMINEEKIEVYGFNSDIRGLKFLDQENFSDFAEQLNKCSLSICLGSTVIIDSLAAGVLPISLSFTLTPNQDGIHPKIWYKQEHLKFICSELTFPIVNSYDELVQSIDFYYEESRRKSAVSSNGDAMKRLIGLEAKSDILEVLT